MKIQERSDIQAVVIGAGPSGLACVKELIKLKAKVLLIHISESNELKMGGNAINWHSQCAIYEEEEFLSQNTFDKWPIDYDEYMRYVKEVEGLLEVKPQRNNNEEFVLKFEDISKTQIHRVQTLVGTSKTWDEIFELEISNPLLEVIDGNVQCLIHDKNVNGLLMRGGETLLFQSAKIYLAAGCLGNTEILARSKFKSLDGSKVFGKYLSDHPMFENISFRDGKRTKYFPLFERKKIAGVLQLKKNKFRVKVDGKVIGVFEVRHFFTKRSLGLSSRLSLTEVLKGLINLVGKKCFNFTFFRPIESQLWIQLAQEQNQYSSIFSENQSFHFNWELSEQDLVNYNKIKDSAEKLLGEWGFVVDKQKTIHDLKTLQASAIPAYHPSGTTRMHNDPDIAVVDGSGKFVGIDNLFVCGSSTFPTPSWVNPTLTSIALSIRTTRMSNSVKES
jgi:hypothetical protein